ncbi:MAG TPA: GAF and ANTAR domain-containing protein [Ornithinibacter sp.]|nr:GAF and ANTAR domain-containing protein [Ornithinibacter sp.]
MGTPPPAGPPGGRSRELHELAEAMGAVARWVHGAGGRLDGLSRAALERVPGAEGCSVTVLEEDRFETEAATHDWARRADALQYELRRGPCVEAVLTEGVYVSGEVSGDPRWGEWGPRVAADEGVRSVLAHRLVLHGERRALASLNVYARRPRAFDDAAVHLGVLLAAHGALLVTALMARDAAADLAAALQSNREVGMAMGVLMHRHRLTRDEAFDVLRVASQDSDRSLVEVATDVVDTGDLVGLRLPLGGHEAADGASEPGAAPPSG